MTTRYDANPVQYKSSSWGGYLNGREVEQVLHTRLPLIAHDCALFDDPPPGERRPFGMSQSAFIDRNVSDLADSVLKRHFDDEQGVNFHNLSQRDFQGSALEFVPEAYMTPMDPMPGPMYGDMQEQERPSVDGTGEGYTGIDGPLWRAQEPMTAQEYWAVVQLRNLRKRGREAIELERAREKQKRYKVQEKNHKELENNDEKIKRNKIEDGIIVVGKNVPIPVVKEEENNGEIEDKRAVYNPDDEPDFPAAAGESLLSDSPLVSPAASPSMPNLSNLSPLTPVSKTPNAPVDDDDEAKRKLQFESTPLMKAENIVKDESKQTYEEKQSDSPTLQRLKAIRRSLPKTESKVESKTLQDIKDRIAKIESVASEKKTDADKEQKHAKPKSKRYQTPGQIRKNKMEQLDEKDQKIATAAYKEFDELLNVRRNINDDIKKLKKGRSNPQKRQQIANLTKEKNANNKALQELEKTLSDLGLPVPKVNYTPKKPTPISGRTRARVKKKQQEKKKE